MCVSHGHLWAQECVGSPAKIAKMAGRPDPLKVFMGSMRKTVRNRDVEEFFAAYGLTVDKVMIPPQSAKYLYAFVTFWTEEEAARACYVANGNLNGALLGPGAQVISAHRGGHHMGVFFQLLAKLVSVVSKIILDL